MTELYELFDGLYNFFAPKSPIFQKCLTEEGETGNSKVLYFTSKRKNSS